MINFEMKRFRLREARSEIFPRLQRLQVLSPDTQIWLSDSNPILFSFITWRQVINLGLQIAHTLHSNYDTLKSMLEISLEGHKEDSQVRVEPFRWRLYKPHIKRPNDIRLHMAFKDLWMFLFIWLFNGKSSPDDVRLP